MNLGKFEGTTNQLHELDKFHKKTILTEHPGWSNPYVDRDNLNPRSLSGSPGSLNGFGYRSHKTNKEY